MKNTALDYMHRLLAESLYRGYAGARPSHQEATYLAALSVRWFRELLLRLSTQHCLDEIDPVDEPPEIVDVGLGMAMGTGDSRDEALWEALCEGRLVLRIDGDHVDASVVPRTEGQVLH